MVRGPVGTHDGSVPQATRDRRPFLVWGRRVGLLLVTVVVAEYAVVRLGVGARASWDSAWSATPWLLLVGLGLELASFVSFSRLTAVLLADGSRVRFSTVLAVDLTGNGVAHVVPGGGAAAAGFRFHLLERVGVPRVRAVSAAAVESAVTTLWLVAALGLGLLVAVPLPATRPFLRTALVAAAVILVCFGGLVAVLAVRPDHVVIVTHAIADRVPGLKAPWFEALVAGLVRQVHVLVADRRAAARALSWGLAYWGLDALALYVMLLAFGVTPNPGGVLVTYALCSLVALVPLTPGGLGFVETVAVPVLLSFGVPRTAALLGVLSWRLVQFWLPIPLAGAAYLWLRLRTAVSYS